MGLLYRLYHHQVVEVGMSSVKKVQANMTVSEPVLHLRLVDIAANPHIMSLYNSLRSVLPEAVWWVSDETLGRIPFPAAPTTPFCSEALLNEDLRNQQIQKGQQLHIHPPPPG